MVEGILADAYELIYGEREDAYGDPKINLKNIAELWTRYINIADAEVDITLSPIDVCAMMIIVKLCRMGGDYHHDSVVDIAGYAALMERVNG